MLERRFKLGSYFGTPLFVHWTFALLLLLVVYLYHDQGVTQVLYGVVVLVSVFVCVTLHEYGHVLAARRFGIPTLDITLSPIGGVARLQRMPRAPVQELIVAIAGPAVNVVIAGVLTLGLLLAAWGAGIFAPPFLGGFVVDVSDRVDVWVGGGDVPTLPGYAVTLLIVNVMLVVFNAVPAFPMDGGRVLRSILAMITTYRQATRIASRLAIGVAFLMIAVAATAGRPQLLLVAIFILYAGSNEARQVEITETMRGFVAGDFLVTESVSVSMNANVDLLTDLWSRTTVKSIPVVSAIDTVVGMAHLADAVSTVESDPNSPATAGMIADKEVPILRVSTPLDQAIFAADRRNRRLPVADSDGRFLGVLDVDSAALLAKFRQAKSPERLGVPNTLAATEALESPRRLDVTT